jgi:hypothetical protein
VRRLAVRHWVSRSRQRKEGSWRRENGVMHIADKF